MRNSIYLIINRGECIYLQYLRFGNFKKILELRITKSWSIKKVKATEIQNYKKLEKYQKLVYNTINYQKGVIK